ncbi:MAG TPA: histidine kinase [Burkholderiales bacterium]|nr:histidine kinase [Burkholderiales bacterium]
MPSINQNAYPGALPNFRNLGILLRILLLVNGVCLVAAAIKSASIQQTLQEFTAIAALVEPILILSLLVLMVGSPWLSRLSFIWGAGIVLLLELVLTTLVYRLGGDFFGGGMVPLERLWLFSLLMTSALIVYFNMRSRLLSPALAESRLQALQARIRPHFLFNSINAVLSLIRSDTKRAEIALEDLCDLFRVLMADNRQLSTLQQEVDLSRRYLNLEQLRLGERLQVEWHIDNMPRDAQIPPLVLQPLLENAVYHGIEPRTEPGVININIFLRNDQVHIVLRNPYQREGDHHAGNKMAMENIRERLSLHFDVEASLSAVLRGDTYQVQIVMPYVRSET